MFFSERSIKEKQFQTFTCLALTSRSWFQIILSGPCLITSSRAAPKYFTDRLCVTWVVLIRKILQSNILIVTTLKCCVCSFYCHFTLILVHFWFVLLYNFVLTFFRKWCASRGGRVVVGIRVGRTILLYMVCQCTRGAYILYSVCLYSTSSLKCTFVQQFKNLIFCLIWF